MTIFSQSMTLEKLEKKYFRKNIKFILHECINHFFNKIVKTTLPSKHLQHYRIVQQHGIQYVLLGKFQADNLEARFGHYLMFSCSNYLISANQVCRVKN